MKKSKKLSVFYILSSLSLLLVLVFGGVYGIYVSVGLNFVRQSASNLNGVPVGGASNVSFGGSVNFEYSMTGVIILSMALVVLAVFDFVSLIRQIVLFKQFKIVRESAFEKGIEKKVKSKGSIIFFAVLVDILSIVLGVIGIFINSKSFAGNNYAWLFYLIDISIIILALASIVLLIIKLKSFKKSLAEIEVQRKNKEKENNQKQMKSIKVSNYDIDDFEYKLLKLKHMKNSRVISQEEYKTLRDKLLKENSLMNQKSKTE